MTCYGCLRNSWKNSNVKWEVLTCAKFNVHFTNALKVKLTKYRTCAQGPYLGTGEPRTRGASFSRVDRVLYHSGAGPLHAKGIFGESNKYCKNDHQQKYLADRNICLRNYSKCHCAELVFVVCPKGERHSPMLSCSSHGRRKGQALVHERTDRPRRLFVD